eukprot:Nk52_evm1s2603 gene=Nk52_evmTU1s2603
MGRKALPSVRYQSSLSAEEFGSLMMQKKSYLRAGGVVVDFGIKCKPSDIVQQLPHSLYGSIQLIDKVADEVYHIRNQATTFNPTWAWKEWESPKGGKRVVTDTFWKTIQNVLPEPYGHALQPPLLGMPEHPWGFHRQFQSGLASELLTNPVPVKSPHLEKLNGFLGHFKSTFGMHMDRYHLGAMQHLYAGAPKVWYTLPWDAWEKLDHELRSKIVYPGEPLCSALHTEYFCVPDLIPGVRETWQYPGQTVMLFPSTVHWGWSAGTNYGVALEWATDEWARNICEGKYGLYCDCEDMEKNEDYEKLKSNCLTYLKHIK